MFGADAALRHLVGIQLGQDMGSFAGAITDFIKLAAERKMDHAGKRIAHIAEDHMSAIRLALGFRNHHALASAHGLMPEELQDDDIVAKQRELQGLRAR